MPLCCGIPPPPSADLFRYQGAVLSTNPGEKQAAGRQPWGRVTIGQDRVIISSYRRFNVDAPEFGGHAAVESVDAVTRATGRNRLRDNTSNRG